MGVGDARCLLHLLARGPLDAEGDVVEEGVVKEDRLLIHVAHQPAQIGERRLADVHAVDGDGAPLHVVESRQEVDERTLPRAGLPDERHRPSLLDRQVDAPQHPLLSVAEPHVTVRDGLR